MKRAIGGTLFGAALLFACFASYERELPGRDRGKAAAEINVRGGKLTILTYGMPSKGYRRYWQLLHERYGIEVKPVAGCVVSEDLMDFANAFNDVTIEAARRKYGRDVVAEVYQETR